MTKELWINLPVKDLRKSKAFFTHLGFAFHPRHEGSDQMAGLLIGQKKTIVMLFPEATFKNFTQTGLPDTQNSAQVLLSFDVESRSEVDALAQKVTEAGGNLFAPPAEVQGWMYGCAFADPDGHRWNVLYMDMSQMPGA